MVDERDEKGRLYEVLPLLLTERTMNADGREVLFRKKLGKCHAPLYGSHENNDLVELQ